MERNGTSLPPSDRGGHWTLAAITALAVAAAGLITHRVTQAIRLGPEWDTYAFLANAATFAGKGFGYSEPHRPPLMSFLTSLWFRVAPLSEAPIQWLDGALTLSGVLAIYLLLRRRMSIRLSFAGGIGFLAITPVWEWLGVGYTDTASVSLSLWALLAAIWATERDSRWYLLLGPLFMLATLTRFTALLAGFPIAVWIVLRWSPFRHAGKLVWAALAAVVTYLPGALYYTLRMGDALFPFLFALTLSEVVSSPGAEGAVQADAFYYVRNAPDFLGSQELIAMSLLLIALGATALLHQLFSSGFRMRKPAIGSLLLAATGVTIAVAAQLVGGLVTRQIAIPVGIIIVWRALAPLEQSDDGRRPRVTAHAALHAAMLVWLLAYFDFHGHQMIQLPRYFIPMAPPFLYFLLLGWSYVASWASELADSVGESTASRKRAVRRSVEIAVMASLLILATSTALTPPLEPFISIESARSSASWIEENASPRDILVSDVWPHTSWFLRTDVPPMPLFEEDSAFGHELEKRAADFYITVHPSRTYENYSLENSNDNIHVLRRDATSPDELPRIVYLGTTWDAYVERLLDNSIYLESTAGRYGFEGTSFMDALTADELRHYDAIAIASFRWHDRSAGETAILEFVESGGSVIIDASQNVGGLASSVADTIMFDVVIRRGELPESAPIVVAPPFADRHPNLDDITTAVWVDEDGGAWNGARYESRTGTPPLETLATAGGRPLVQLQRIGHGRIYWISYNMVWHAFISGNDDEAQLVRAVFSDALLEGR